MNYSPEISDKQVYILSDNNVIENVMSFAELCSTILDWTKWNERKVMEYIISWVVEVLEKEDFTGCVLSLPEDVSYRTAGVRTGKDLKIGEEVSIVWAN